MSALHKDRGDAQEQGRASLFPFRSLTYREAACDGPSCWHARPKAQSAEVSLDG